MGSRSACSRLADMATLIVGLDLTQARQAARGLTVGTFPLRW
jgi:hypothetical protein